MRTELDAGYHLTPVRDGDQAAYVEHLRDSAIAGFMLLIPFPYTYQDAHDWVSMRLARARRDGPETEFALRRPDGFLVGAIGLTLGTGEGSHRAHVGYWVAREYRGQGLATAMLRTVIDYAFGELGILRVQTGVFCDNPASQRVLEKAGLVREGLLAGYHFKNGQLRDSYMYGLAHRFDAAPSTSPGDPR